MMGCSRQHVEDHPYDAARDMRKRLRAGRLR